MVGGCVRDSLLGRLPGDWDICTSARPDEMKALFCSQRLILTGEKHGTVAVILHGKPYEMTTYRLDGSYRDHRHPDNVQFVDDLAADLARRDFTINAMAYAPGEGVIDLYGGRSDLAARVVRCVGTPADRFAEDALRILRALRFSAKLGFALDPATAAAALAARDTLRTVSAERLYTELDGLLLAPGAGQTLAQYGEILSGAVPEILPCIGCTQPGKWHCYDVWQHSAAAVGVEARRSLTMSQIEVSGSWPIPVTTGTGQAATARASSSSLKVMRSSKEPPPRTSKMTSGVSACAAISAEMSAAGASVP